MLVIPNRAIFYQWSRQEVNVANGAISNLAEGQYVLPFGNLTPAGRGNRTVRQGSRRVRHYDKPRTSLDLPADMPGTDRLKVEQLLSLRSRLDPFILAKIIRPKFERIWHLRPTGKSRQNPSSFRTWRPPVRCHGHSLPHTLLLAA